MSLEKPKGDKKGKSLVGRKPKLSRDASGKTPWDVVADIAESSTSLSEVAEKATKYYRKENEKFDKITIPTAAAYLKKAWGDDYQKKKEEMSERRSNRRKWKQEFSLARQGIGDIFKKDYLSPNDGIYFNQETGNLESMPFMLELGRYWREIEVKDPETGEKKKRRQALPKKNVINFSKEADFGWSEDPTNPDALGTLEPTTQGIVLRQMIKRVEGLVDEKKKRYIKSEVDKELVNLDLTTVSVEDIPKIYRETTRRVRKERVEEIKALDEEKVKLIGSLLTQLSRGDNRSKFTHSRDLLKENVCPAYSSSDKKWRGKQRMTSLPGEVFSRAVQNLPFVLFMHSKRLQVHSHNLSKNLPELLEPEVPRVKARFNDIPGINGRVRFPKNTEEHITTMEAGMIVSEDFAKKFKYFTVVEDGTLIAEQMSDFKDAPRRHVAIKNHKDYKEFKDRVKGVSQVDRLDPITVGGFEEIGHGIANRFARHSGELVFVGQPKRKTRKITLAQGADGDKIIEIEYWAQDYQIVREDVLRVGDKLLDRSMSYDTEILTDRGWIFMPQLTIEDRVATLNSSGIIEYHKPTRLHEHDDDNELYHIKNQQIDLLVTYDHHLYVSAGEHKNLHKNDLWEFVEAKILRQCSSNDIPWYMNVGNNEYVPVYSKDIKVVPYTGKTYCVSVPNGIIYVRRSGKPVWCGNSGLKGIVSDIRKNLGKDDKGRPYSLIANYDEVWREADRSTAEGKLKDDTFYKQGKKKSAIVLEHEKGDGEIFFFLIDKFAQDSTTTGLSFSPTLVSGLWERALDQLPEGATERERDEMVEQFSERYFRGEGNLVTTLKALHYKAVKKDGIVTIMVDEREPTADESGEIVELPHTYAGNTYQYAYIPHYISRVYFDSKTFREIYIAQEDATPNDASDFYWFNVMKQAKNRFRLFPRQDMGIQLVTRPWAEDPKDVGKYDHIELNYLDVIDLGLDPHAKDLVVTYRKEPVTSADSIQTHPVKVDWKNPLYDADATRGCYDDQTEILTEGGWKYFVDLTGEERVATLNPRNNSLEYHLPKRFVEYEHNDKMYRLQTRMLDLLVTPDHRMWVADVDNKFKIETPEDMFGKKKRFDTIAEWNGIEQEHIIFPDVVKRHEFSSKNQYTDFDCVRDVTFEGKRFKMDDWVEFLGYYISEGNARRNSAINITQYDVEKREKIINCIQRLGYNPNITDSSRIIFSDIIIAGYLESLGKATEKYISRDILGLSTRQLKILYDALMLGDGCVSSHIAYYTSSKQLADDFQELCLKIGFSAAIFGRDSRVSYIDGRKITSQNKQYTVNIRTKKHKPIINDRAKTEVEEWVDYKGMAYCVEVENGLVYVRRGGKPVWCGNTAGLNPVIALKSTIDYDGDTIAIFAPPIVDAISNFDEADYKMAKEINTAKYDMKIEDLYDKAKLYKYGKDEIELGIKTARYNQETAETENELIERLGGLRKRSLILQGKKDPPVVTIGRGSGEEEEHQLTMSVVNRITDVEKILKMKEPRWLLKQLYKKPWNEITTEEKDIVRDYHIRKELQKVVDEAVRDPGVRKLYDLLKQPSEYMKEEFMSKAGESDPIGMKLDTRDRLLDRILFNEIRESSIFVDLDEE